jgi:hypothetical protein
LRWLFFLFFANHFVRKYAEKVADHGCLVTRVKLMVGVKAKSAEWCHIDAQ